MIEQPKQLNHLVFEGLIILILIAVTITLLIGLEFFLEIKNGLLDVVWEPIITGVVFVLGLSVIVLLHKTKRIMQYLSDSVSSDEMTPKPDEKLTTSSDNTPVRQSLGYPGYLNLGTPLKQFNHENEL